MTRDANQIARDAERQEQRQHLEIAAGPRRGHLQVWNTVGEMTRGVLAIFEASNVTTQVLTSGWLLVQYETGENEMLFPEPGWYVSFEPNRARE